MHFILHVYQFKKKVKKVKKVKSNASALRLTN